MDYKLFKSNITDSNVFETIENKVDFYGLDENNIYDISVEYYNNDLNEEMLNENAAFEIKRKHYVFIKEVRNLFEKHNIKINKFHLMGTIIDLKENEMSISILKSNYDKKSNTVWPCKEIFIFEDSKNKLDDLLFNNQISEEDYESNLEILKDELNIYEKEDEMQYLN
ncbi:MULTISPECIES: hypothetical protein [unclassified Sedimentibacter]|uniref:hypothetical protein n=1 Tax=unclassified Sedimentibacter TaxID=2649220 RepID=UPI0027E0FA8F|nr:hypothetical protein [Sedimentibacter sp. MB35-C1]WMJ75833.1 hypothetical protein RBQ61_09330 [Sedimentibacter sp. MB35-C1]